MTDMRVRVSAVPRSLTPSAGAVYAECPDCDNRLLVDAPMSMLIHHADGSHEFIPGTEKETP